MAKLQESAARSAYLKIVEAHERLTGDFSDLFREYGLSHTQFNVLRILVTGSKNGEPCSTIAARLIHRVPDVTRIIDRMESAELVQRERSAEDRRVVLVRITTKGRRLCESLYEPVSRLHRRQFAHVPKAALGELNDALDAVLNGDD